VADGSGHLRANQEKVTAALGAADAIGVRLTNGALALAQALQKQEKAGEVRQVAEKTEDVHGGDGRKKPATKIKAKNNARAAITAAANLGVQAGAIPNVNANANVIAARTSINALNA
jgi:hypothetical protein